MESSYEVEGPHYFTILAMHILSPEQWRSSRVYFLRRLLVAAHARKVSAVSTNKYDTLPCIGPVFFWFVFYDVVLHTFDSEAVLRLVSLHNVYAFHHVSKMKVFNSFK